MPLTENLADFKEDNEAKLVNHFDELGDLPEYIPFSLVAYGFEPLTKWTRNNNTFEKVEPRTIFNSTSF